MGNPGQGSSVWLVLQVIVVFLIVAALAVYALRFLSRRWPGLGGGRHLRLIEQLHLAPNRMVCLIAVADRILVLGVSERSVELLQAIDDPETVAAMQPVWTAGSSSGGESFASRLRQLLGREGAASGVEREDGGGVTEDRTTWPDGLRLGLERLRQLRQGEEAE